LNIKNTTTYEVGNQGPGFGEALKYGGVKPVNDIPPFPYYLDLQRQYRYKKTYTITKINDNINMDRTIAGSMNARSKLTSSSLVK